MDGRRRASGSGVHRRTGTRPEVSLGVGVLTGQAGKTGSTSVMKIYRKLAVPLDGFRVWPFHIHCAEVSGRLRRERDSPFTVIRKSCFWDVHRGDPHILFGVWMALTYFL
jgi:hypothetical protein